MAKFILAPVWSMEWKVALIVLLSLAILICVVLIAYVAIALKKSKRRAAEDDFEARDDGGFSKIVRAEDYGVTMPAGYSVSDKNPVVVPAPIIKPVSLNAPPYAGQYSAQGYEMNAPLPQIPADISARLGYIPAPYGSSAAPQFINPDANYVAPVSVQPNGAEPAETSINAETNTSSGNHNKNSAK